MCSGLHRATIQLYGARSALSPSERPRRGPGCASDVETLIGIRSGLDVGVVRSITFSGPVARAPPRAAVRARARGYVRPAPRSDGLCDHALRTALRGLQSH
eukprot:4996058-Prymnesium_polylepis.1